jgi:glycosyltransferase involved in cell wall biosynthesis
MPRIYTDLNVLVVSSDSEGTPVSIIEAMAAGCPVVATGVRSVPDLIINGKTGHLVPPGDADGLARAILRVLQEPQSASLMAQTSRGLARGRFSVNRLISETEKLYSHLLERKGIIT